MIFIVFLFLQISLTGQNTDNGNFGSDKAIAFVNSLNAAQKKKVMFPFDELNRFEWHYLPASTVARDGISVSELNSAQQKNLYALMQTCLSAEGYTRTKNIMSFEDIIKELEPGNPSRIPENYFVAIYGEPHNDRAWGWKFSGHHIALNFTIVNGKLAFAPFFFGVYPAEVTAGESKGMRIMKDEEDLGFKLVNSLSQEQKQKAIFQVRAFSDIITTNDVKVVPPEPVGILAKDLNHEQKIILNKLIVAYLLSMPPAIAKIRIEKIAREDMDNIWFGWAGGTERGKPHYYRVQGKTFLIEYDNTQNNANHIHSVWRDFNGDFGNDLLREHYRSSSHHQ